MGFDDGEQDAVFEFHVFVVKTDGTAIVDSCDFHPDEVVGVVDDAHLVGFGIADSDSGGVVRHWFSIVARCPRERGHGRLKPAPRLIILP